jgi:hypothetical protein
MFNVCLSNNIPDNGGNLVIVHVIHSRKEVVFDLIV